MLRAVSSLGIVRSFSADWTEVPAFWACYRTAARKFEGAVLHLWAQHPALDATL